MSWNPTSWDALPDNLKKLFHEIICWKGSTIAPVLNEAVKQIMNHPTMNAQSFYAHCQDNGITEDKILIETCWDFVKYQLSNEKICDGKYAIFEQEGFQIGSPWHGDILQAPILFLSINPGVTHKCLFPRWNWKHNTYAFGGEQNGSMNYFITYMNDNGANVQIGNVIHNDREIYDFLTNRFLTTCLDHNGTPKVAPTIWYPNAWIIQSGNTCSGKSGNGVNYWHGIRNTMELLLGFAPYSRITRDETRRLMRPVLSTEMVFWGSQGGKGTGGKRPKYFFDKFIKPMLENCGARIMFVVGKSSTLETFYKILIQSGEVYRPFRNRFGEEIVIAAVNHFSQTKQNYPQVVSSIRNLKGSNQVIHEALKEAKRIYNQ